MGLVWLAVELLLAVLLAWVSVLAESAIARIDRVKAHQLAQDERPGAPALLRIVEDPATPVATLHLFTGLMHFAGAGLVAVWAIRDGRGTLGSVAGVALAWSLFAITELAARSISVQRAERVALRCAGTVVMLSTVLSPIVKLLVGMANLLLALIPGRRLPKGPFATEEEIRSVVDPIEEEEPSDEEDEEDERELIHSVFEFGDSIVREVMVPRPDMVAMRADASLEDALKVIVDAGYSRIPIYDGDLDNIVGVLYAKDLMRRMHEVEKQGRTVGSLGRGPTFVPETKRLNELLREMQDQHVHMAVVVDEYGGTAGLVTIEDLIEEIVGEIVDEFDREEPLVEPIDETTMRVDAKMPIDEVNELLGCDLPHDEWDTVGGLVYGLTGRVPTPGETVRFDGLQFTTERVTGRRIQKVVIRRSDTPDEQ